MKLVKYILCFTALVLSLSSNAHCGEAKRDYYEKPTKSDKEDIRYIVTTLATSSWTKLYSDKASLKRAGDRVDHVHPLKFLSYCFTDDELKGSIHCIRDRSPSKIWKEFFGGLSDSLEEEARRNNVLDEMIEDFASLVKVKPSSITSSIHRRDWDGFVELLLKHIPRLRTRSLQYVKYKGHKGPKRLSGLSIVP